MIPLTVLVLSFLGCLVAGRAGVRPLRSRVTCLRWALAAMFLLTASAHWGSRRADLIQMVPPVFPAPGLLVTLTGVAELLGAAGLLIPWLAPWAAAGLATLLLAMFPANVHAAHAGLTIHGRAVMGVGPRGLVQLVFLGAVLAAGFAPWWRARRLVPRPLGATTAPAATLTSRRWSAGATTDGEKITAAMGRGGERPFAAVAM